LVTVPHVVLDTGDLEGVGPEELLASEHKGPWAELDGPCVCYGRELFSERRERPGSVDAQCAAGACSR
jgi:hypothetical protein